MKFDTISFGSAVLDVFLTSSDIKVIRSTEFFTNKAIAVPYGTKSEVERLVICSGGGGTNTAVGFSRLGLKAAVVARSGWDFAGKIIRQEIKKEGVDDQFLVQIEGEETDYSTILVSPDGDRTILVYRGGTRLDKKIIDFKKLNAFWFYLSSLEGNLALIEELTSYAKKNSIKMAVNPGRKELEQKKKFLKIAQDFDILILNREEAAKLLGVTIVDDKVFDKACLTLPKVMVVTTEGSKGAHVCVPQKGKLITDGFKMKVVEVTGAGDGFGAGLIAGLAKGWDLEKALKLGVSNGAAAVTQFGAKAGLIREKEIDFWLNKKLNYHWEKG
ncbi:MAG TPA: carbohydrate kinase family protein [Patescibacteria group bacterium]|nr:carbohydrate kinase family protein [Patescibacteria group bacterium]